MKLETLVIIRVMPSLINYTSADVPFTRVIEHKWFEHGRGDSHKTVVTHEYPQEWNRNREPYYSVNDRKDLSYQKAHNVIFGGRLGQYHCYNMN